MKLITEKGEQKATRPDQVGDVFMHASGGCTLLIEGSNGFALVNLDGQGTYSGFQSRIPDVFGAYRHKFTRLTGKQTFDCGE